MWRARSAGSDLPFPDATAAPDGGLRFDADEVVAWLTATGRGNNADAPEEVALHAGLDLPMPQATIDRGLTALLAIKAVTGEQLGGRTAPQILDVADDVDPHDRCLYREVVALGDHLMSVAAHADAVASAGFTPLAAMESILTRRSRLMPNGQTRTALASPVLDLVAGITAEMAGLYGEPVTAAVDPSGGSDLLVAIRSRFDLADLPAASLSGGDSADARLARRRLVAHGWHVTPSMTDDDGHLGLPPHALVVAQFPSPVAPTVSDEQVLTAIDDIVLAMDDSHTGVVVGPSSALVDRPASVTVERARASLLRTNRVRAVVRLPAGLRTGHPRERLALWVLGPAHDGVPIRQRWTVLADVTEPLTTIVNDALITDVVASLGQAAAVRSHAFRYGRLSRTSEVIARSGDLVARVRPRHPVDRAAAVDEAARITELVAAVREPAPGTHVAVDVVALTGGGTRAVTLGQLVDDGVVRPISGNRIDSADLGDSGDVRAIGPEQVHGSPRRRFVDRLGFSSRYPAGRYTEPGDIIVTTSGAPGAVIDDAGLAVVVFPARVLRLDREAMPGLVPAVVVHAIRAVSPGTPWRSWPVPLVPDGAAPVLARVLADVAVAQQAARARLTALDDLAARLTDGAAAGVVGLVPQESQEG
ncbi:hypothetical protein [Georgenia sp. MJ170]|uniref:hypothetical protein n=1 Tax=Georgenia sunbinii TaxID=3117728 RepID=UPI002F264D35